MRLSSWGGGVGLCELFIRTIFFFLSLSLSLFLSPSSLTSSCSIPFFFFLHELSTGERAKTHS